MLSPFVLRLRRTQSSAISTRTRLVMPSAPATLTLTSRAPGRDALVAGLGIGARDHARHVRAVAERVEPAQVGVVGVLGEVGAADELAGAVEGGDAEHAGVDQRDVDARTGEPAALGA